MTKEDLLDLLKEHLVVRVETNLESGWYGDASSVSTKVAIYFDNELVSHDSTSFLSTTDTKRLMTQKYTRHSVVSTEDVLPKISRENKKKVVFDNQPVNVDSHRLLVFKNYGLSCAKCGITGLFFAIEKNDDTPKYHLNLWAKDSDGNEVLMTQYKKTQTMCLPCSREQYVIDRK